MVNFTLNTPEKILSFLLTHVSDLNLRDKVRLLNLPPFLRTLRGKNKVEQFKE